MAAAGEPAVDASPGYVRVRVTSSLSSHGSENKFLTSITIGELKVRRGEEGNDNVSYYNDTCIADIVGVS